MNWKEIKYFIPLGIFLIINPACQRHENSSAQAQNAMSDSLSDDTQIMQFPDFRNQISDVVRTVLQDSNGTFWFGTQNGAFMLSGNTMTHIGDIKSESGTNVTIKDIVEGNDGVIWFGHTDGLSSFDGKDVTNYYESDGLINNDVWCLLPDSKDQLWIGTINGVSKYYDNKFEAFILPEGRIDTTVGVSSTRMIHDIMEDSQGRIWFSTNGGVWYIENNNLFNISDKHGLKSSFVNQVIEDDDGNFWMSTSDGFYKYTSDSLIDISAEHFDVRKGVGSMVEDSNNSIWFNCSRDIYCLKAGVLHEYRISEGNYGPLTFEIYEDNKNRLWFVGYGGAYRLDQNKFVNVTREGPF